MNEFDEVLRKGPYSLDASRVIELDDLIAAEHVLAALTVAIRKGADLGEDRWVRTFHRATKSAVGRPGYQPMPGSEGATDNERRQALLDSLDQLVSALKSVVRQLD